MKQLNPEVKVFFDGGVRRGHDAFKALAYGADMVFIARPSIWGLHMRGSEGVKEVIEMLNKELETTMILTKCKSLEDIKADFVQALAASQG